MNALLPDTYALRAHGTLAFPGFRHALFRFLMPVLAMLLALAVPMTSASAASVTDLPVQPPQERVLDQANVLSRASRGEIERLLEEFQQERVDARLVTIDRLDYGLSLDQVGRQLLRSWSDGADAGDTPSPQRLLLLIDAQTRATAVVSSSALQRQLPAALLRSTARTTMALPLRNGERYRQAVVDGLARLSTVLRGGEDPGEPMIQDSVVVESNVPTREETASSNAFTWVVVLLVVGSVVPMLTWWVFSR
jgi:uncharacterized protein